MQHVNILNNNTISKQLFRCSGMLGLGKTCAASATGCSHLGSPLRGSSFSRNRARRVSCHNIKTECTEIQSWFWKVGHDPRAVPHLHNVSVLLGQPSDNAAVVEARATLRVRLRVRCKKLFGCSTEEFPLPTSEIDALAAPLVAPGHSPRARVPRALFQFSLPND